MGARTGISFSSHLLRANAISFGFKGTLASSLNDANTLPEQRQEKFQNPPLTFLIFP
jgi:hypothetical protein